MAKRKTKKYRYRHKLPDPAQRQRFRRRLLSWYGRYGRDLPWRHTVDPYRVLVSEIMLQQTQVDRVIPKYEFWIKRYPRLDFETSSVPGTLWATTLDQNGCLLLHVRLSHRTAVNCPRMKLH
jgi:hypothetical protein